MNHAMYEAREMRQRRLDAADDRADFWRDKYVELQERHRQGLLHESPSLALARQTLAKQFEELRQQIAAAQSDAAAAADASGEAILKRDRALVAAQRAQTLVDEILDQVASKVSEAFRKGQKSRRLLQIGGGVLLGVLTSFVATWLFELYRLWIL